MLLKKKPAIGEMKRSYFLDSFQFQEALCKLL